MRNTLLAAATVAFALATGATFAANVVGTANAQTHMPNLEIFHTNASMTDLRTPDEMRKSFGALSASEQQALRDECLSTVPAGATESKKAVDKAEKSAEAHPDRPVTFTDLCHQVSAW